MASVLLTLLISIYATVFVSGSQYNYDADKEPSYSQYGMPNLPMMEDGYRENSKEKSRISADYKYEDIPKDSLDKSDNIPLDDEEPTNKWQKPARKTKVSPRFKLASEYLSSTRQAYPKHKYNSPRHMVLRAKKDDQSDNRFEELNNDDEFYDKGKIEDDEIYSENKKASRKRLDIDDDLYNRKLPLIKVRRRPRDRENIDDKNDNNLDIKENNIVPTPPQRTFAEANEKIPIENMYQKESKVKLGQQSKGNDYYDEDMKRVNKIKNHLPEILQEAKAKTTEPSSVENPFERRFDLIPDEYGDDDARTTTKNRLTKVKLVSSEEISTSTLTTPTHTTTRTLTTTAQTAQLEIRTESINKSEELSLAEMSRQSILRKVQRKEGMKDVLSTKKPPVLMQVTQRMVTVVMVEPGNVNKEDPWMRAREVSDDTPDKLAKVKRLMRKKLMSNAKNIKDLTENWDEMMCDYVDMSAIDKASNNISVLFFVLCNSFLLLFWF